MEKLFVIKIGGNIIDDEKKLSSFLKNFASVKAKKILVHGGGKLATKLAAQLGVEQQLIDGRRITDAETLKIVTMVYAGDIDLIYSFETAGVLMNADDDSTLITLITQSSYKDLKEQKVIHSGMIPKLDNAFAALNKGVNRVLIGRAEQLEDLISGNAGTSI